MAFDYFTCTPNIQENPDLWDTEWNCDCLGGDWVLLDKEAHLRSHKTLRTAVLLCLFTDKHAYDDDQTPHDNEDRRGWWGDGVDINAESGERELGSRLWLLERSILNEETRIFAEEEAKNALQTLIDQGAVARIEALVELSYSNNSLTLNVKLYSRDGNSIYDQKFQRYWEQLR